MSKLQVPDFEKYEDEAEFWDKLDTADFMEEDDEWFRFETPHQRAVHVAILPEIAEELILNAQARGVSMETLVNVLLLQHLRESVVAS